jgi:hypothetical protein
MATLTARIDELRELLRNAEFAQADSFSNVFDAFLKIAEQTELMDACKPFKDKTLRMILENVVRRYAKDESLTLSQAQFLHHAPTGLVHGMFVGGHHAGTFFYFLSEQQGLVAFAASMSMMHYFRITATELPPGTVIGRPKKKWKN